MAKKKVKRIKAENKPNTGRDVLMQDIITTYGGVARVFENKKKKLPRKQKYKGLED